MTEETIPADSLKAADLIRDEARRAPDKPGVYRMYGEDGACLYVGKARSLKKRILQYAQGRFHTQRIGLMVSLTRSMELVVTASETEALLLESNFIKKLKPRFNVVLQVRPDIAASRGLPWYSWVGGLYGAIFVVAAAWGVPRLGVATTIILMVAGQLLLSVVLDHFGAMGMPKQPISLGRVAGIGLVIAGVLMVRKF